MAVTFYTDLRGRRKDAELDFKNSLTVHESKENNPERTHHILGHLSQRFKKCQHACCGTSTQTYRLLQLFLQNS